MTTDDHRIWSTPSWLDRAQELRSSYEAAVGQPLIESAGANEAAAEALFLAPFVVVSHGIESDPVLNYGNAAALTLWNVNAETLCAMPSRLTAEPVHRDERAAMLARVTQHGYIDDYAGIRITADGRRFHIERATVWNVFSTNGRPAGQAAMFKTYTWLSSPKE